MEEKGKSITLYDVGGGIFFLVFFGIPFGSVLDYLWNLLVLWVSLPRLPGDTKIKLTKGKRLAYCFFITVIGFIIDWAYFELTWDMDFGRSMVWAPAMSRAFQFIWLLMPIAMIWAVNSALSYSYLKLERKQAIILGAIMGIFTAPWILPTLPYVFGWTI